MSLRCLKQRKRGDVSEGIIFLVIIFFLAVSFVVVAFVNDKLRDVVATTPLNQTTAANDIINGMDNITQHSIQNGFMIIFTFLIIGMMLSSFLVRVHPAWIAVYIFFAAFAVILAVLIANTYSTMVASPALHDIAEQQTMISWVMRHIVQVLIGAVVLSMIILFAKPPAGAERI